jgi:hypothetical protein
MDSCLCSGDRRWPGKSRGEPIRSTSRRRVSWGNRHIPTNTVVGNDVVAAEWSFEAEHTGECAGRAASGSSVKVTGYSVYEYDAAKRLVAGGRICVGVATLLKQMKRRS